MALSHCVQVTGGGGTKTQTLHESRVEKRSVATGSRLVAAPGISAWHQPGGVSAGVSYNTAAILLTLSKYVQPCSKGVHNL